MKNFFNLFKLTKNYKMRYIIGIIFIILVDILQLILPIILGRVTDLFQMGNLTNHKLFIYVFQMILIGFFIFIFRFLWRYLVQGSARRLERDLRNNIYKHLSTLNQNFYNKNTTGDLMAHATNDINNVFMSLGQGIAFLFDSTFIPLFAIIMLIIIGGLKFTLITLIPLVFLAIAIFLMSNVMQKRVKKMQEAFSDLTEFVRETISGIRVIKGFVQENKQVNKFSRVNRKNKNMNIRYLTLTSMLFPIVMSISAISFSIIIWYGGRLVINNEISLGDFVAYNSYIGLLTWPIAAFGWMVNIFQRGIVSKKRIDKILDTLPEITDENSDNNIDKIEGEIEFKNVYFKYPGSEFEVLHDIDFKIHKGKSLAIIGKTGSGKTTIARLLMRFYDIDRGQIFIDKNSIKNISFNVLRSHVSLVPQDSFLFSETIKENINFFREFNDMQIEEYSKISKVYEDINEFSNKFDTFVGEKGITLSGGQKQRISISRSLIGESEIIIFDDCLSAVDAKTEEDILNEFDNNLEDKTRIIISNRISAIKNSDMILVLKDGRIHERGTHKELLKNNDLYSELYNIQILEKKVR
ncbi:MAG: ABC transporter ATP-binding protein [Clostridiales bacterium]